LLDTNIIKPEQIIFKTYKGKRFEGKILSDGRIELTHDGGIHNSLSAAAINLAKTSINGWVWWHTINEKNAECSMDALRKKYKKQ